MPQQAFFDIEAYPEFSETIGIVFIKVINLHPFEDGNKRTAVMAAVIMAKLNGIQIDFSNREIAELALCVAKTDESQLQYEDIYAEFDRHLHQLR
ncbi:type II toxin-antitoxin system death-on-curing family toxin [Lactobacillus sp. ZJLC29-4]|uniref:Type II toxin-antitoxin system death-on-curing family toxin n=1 Tax=Levilactobacillus tujiorum TaxID=2912243 RepID=A0ABX1L8E8_9LACO|nr:type II toxin-antitoxin system death-on-curing family toxin [Levilactobacillus tujiorum]NLR12194.1 type II toxin-antitoxin system death-on-curing family toxin [Lactobacillus sp. HBUAS51387]NLR30157.1 type II toxin-antitoxin system death-on-curing family toxin [Levilactobacillus tujiorum]